MSAKLLFATAFAAAFSCAPALAQTYRDTGGTVVPSVVPVSPGGGPLFTSSNPGQIAGSFSASLGGFTPSASGARMTPLTVTTADSYGTLPSGTVAVVSNVGSNPMYCNVNGVAATASDELIPASSWFAFTVPSGVTTLHCIATGGSTTANAVGGAGLPTGAGGGGGSGGSVPTGSAGSPNASVVSVQGISGGTAQPVSQSGTWTVTGAGGTFPATESGTWNITNISGAVSLPTGAATSANQTNGTQLSQLTDASSHPLGTYTAYGTAPSGYALPVNAYVTNANGNGQQAMSGSSPVVLASNQAVSSAGWTPYLANGLSTTPKTVDAGAGVLGFVQCYNPNTSQAYVQVFNTASPTLGSTTPALSVPIGPTATSGLAMSGYGVALGGSAIVIAATTTATGSTAPSTAVDCNVGYH